MKLQNEYLVIIDKESATGFYGLCNSIKRFNESIELQENLHIKNKKIYRNKVAFDYSIKMGNVKGKEQRFFYMTIGYLDKDDNLDEYKNLLRDIKSILHKNETIIETLRDDLSFSYSQKAYSLIHEIENLMRKFITYFMITSVGKNWIEESSPEQIKKALESSKRKQYIDVLQQLDFIHLGDFLFKSYQGEDISHLFDKIEAIDDIKEVDINELKNHIPKSNWDKFFKEKVECNDKYLKTRWEKLYDLRNKIAHTSYFTEGNYKDIETLVDDVREKLEQAFNNIDNIEIEEEEKEQLSENIAVNANEYIGKYLKQWNQLEDQIKSMQTIDYTKTKSFQSYLKSVESANLINTELVKRIQKMGNVRNELVHNMNFSTNENIITYYKHLEKLNIDLKYSWKDEVVKALTSIGGTASLEQIYDYIKSNTNRNLTDSWKSSVRKTIYHYSSDTEVFLGNEDLFERVGKGEWKLKE